ncbi:MAG TPA: pyridoxal kinase PdxY [Bdellovibrionota bacterium]|jgi:pyridoxine kinase|nr:pyridoxal kinase PdxY [Bdellovibrionota bacterium]
MQILSVQSHVCYGYVGNRAASFPLQRMGFDVNAVNTVQFSNHSGYGAWKGEIFGAPHLREIFEGLAARDVFKNSAALLSGYLGSRELGACVLEAAERLKAANPKAIYLCDPVMGDVGRGYFVKPEIPDFFVDEVIPRADIITPNHFEFNRIAGEEITSLEQMARAMDRVHARGPRLIVVTSFLESASPGHAPTLKVLLSVKGGARYYVESPHFQFPVAPTGTGDLFSALFLGNYLKNPASPEVALQRATGGIYRVLKKNHERQTRELEIIAAQDAFLDPELFPIARFA